MKGEMFTLIGTYKSIVDSILTSIFSQLLIGCGVTHVWPNRIPIICQKHNLLIYISLNENILFDSDHIYLCTKKHLCIFVEQNYKLFMMGEKMSNNVKDVQTTSVMNT